MPLSPAPHDPATRTAPGLARVALVVAIAVLGATGGFALHTALAERPVFIGHFYTRTLWELFRNSPMSLSRVRVLEPFGVRGHNRELDHFTLDARRAQIDTARLNLDRLRGYDRATLKADDRVSYDVLAFALDDMAREAPFALHNYAIAQLSSPHTDLPDFMATGHHLGDRRDVDDYVARVGEIPRALDEAAGLAKAQKAVGVVPPKFILVKARADAVGIMETPASAHPLTVSLRERLGEVQGLPEDAGTEAVTKVEAIVAGPVKEAYARYVATIDDLLSVATNDAGVWKLPDGAAYYAYRLRSNTTTELSPDEVHAMGLRVVEELHTEMRAILKGLGYTDEALAGAGLSRTMQDLTVDPRFLFPETDAGRQQAIDRYKAILTEIDAGLAPFFDIKPKAPLTVERVPAFAEATSPQAYYHSPPMDNSKPGIFFINLRSLRELPTWGMRTLSYHEGIPGHHFQIALQQETEGLPMFRRLFGFNAYAEGWALYSERLAAEQGFQKDPYDRLGYLMGQLFRAVRLVVDTGLHSKRWTREEAITYMMDNAGTTEPETVTEIERYIVWPGQACGYMVGALKIRELRAKAQAQLGPKFSLKGFHNVVLTAGSVPLTVLEQLIDDWIAKEGGA
jgi:uncharacterized protein (DUF885 family)